MCRIAFALYFDLADCPENLQRLTAVRLYKCTLSIGQCGLVYLISVGHVQYIHIRYKLSYCACVRTHVMIFKYYKTLQ